MVTLKLTSSGPDITVYPSNGDKQGLNPDSNNEIIITGLGVSQGYTVDPESTDRIVATVIQSVDV